MDFFYIFFFLLEATRLVVATTKNHGVLDEDGGLGYRLEWFFSSECDRQVFPDSFVRSSVDFIRSYNFFFHIQNIYSSYLRNFEISNQTK